YTINIPAGPHRDASQYTHLTFRVAKKDPGIVSVAGSDVNLWVNVEDGQGHKAFIDVPTSTYARIPHPFVGSFFINQAQMSGVRIPLRYFAMNNSSVDLTDIAKITITTEGTTEIGNLDIEFGKRDHRSKHEDF